MEHLVYPDHPAIPPLIIPIICKGCKEYDGIGFYDYPQRQGWASREEPLRWLACDTAVLAQRAQIWLYFGTLSEFVGEVVPVSAFCRSEQSSDATYLSTNSLKDILRTRKHAYQQTRVRRVGATKESWDRAASVLREAARLSELLEQQVTDCSETLSLISCSIRVLLQVLGSAKHYRQRHDPQSRSTASPTNKWFHESPERWRVPPAKAIQHRMTQAGWCPTQVSFLSQKYSCEILYYLSGIRRQTVNVKHEKCTGLQCRAYDIDESHYEPKHTDERCGCALIGSLSTELTLIIEAGGVPLASCFYSSSGQPQLEIVPAKADSRYIAISHVWSGGLGNPHENAIAECQLGRLMHVINDLHAAGSLSSRTWKLSGQPKRYFWLDTLCIPVGDTVSAQQARQRSIADMARIYSRAYRVLVLDVELQRISLNTTTAEEALAHILCSSWMFRCWTLYEAILAQSCYVQFADRAVALRKAPGISQMIQSLNFPGSSSRIFSKTNLVEELSGFITEFAKGGWERPFRVSMWFNKSRHRFQANAFAATWNNFLGRSTTKMEDLHLILGAMQDFKSAVIRDLPVEDRMKAILKGHEMLPVALLYAPGPRLHDDNPLHRWAPEFPQSNKLDHNLGYMKVFSDCLQIVGHGPAHMQLSESIWKPIRQLPNSNLVDKVFTAVTVTLCRFFNVGPLESPRQNLCLTMPKSEQSDRFTINVQTLSGYEQLWVEACPLEGVPSITVEDGMTCILFPNVYDLHGCASWYKAAGARFRVREYNEMSIHLIYDCPLQIYAYDRTASRIRESQQEPIPTFPLLLTNPVAASCRIFIDCDLSSWPSADHIFESPEGPFYEQVSGPMYLFAYLSIHAIWPVSFILVMATASLLHIQRIKVFYCYLGKAILMTVEGIWWHKISKTIERQVWSEDFGSNSPSVPRYYDIINQNPSLLIGLRRALLMVVLMAIFLVVGFTRPDAKWARWAGVMLGVELTGRLVLHVAWLKLPETALGRRVREQMQRQWTRLNEKMRREQSAHMNQEMERVPYRESLDVDRQNFYVFN
ncbi:hypothetical protein GJ744_010681 [Endocarpon pusillum]|uniref:Heterokaryon incompatibility domain-containing protein n=1 Tax=Endocarpon pusillum TaxID=364733 RepID=A0A8H7AH66_9EURO|nr:hypothetical protein GJ744_010681 [Endocarpon pusillum]